MKPYIVGIAAYFVATFVLFTAVWFLPDGSPVTRAVGAASDILFQPFIGPKRLIALPPALTALAGGVPLVLANSLLWGVILAVPLWWRRWRAV